MGRIPAGGQPIGHPLRRGADLHIADDARRIARAEVGVAHLQLHQLVGGLALFLHRRLWHAQRLTSEGGHLTRDARPRRRDRRDGL